VGGPKTYAMEILNFRNEWVLLDQKKLADLTSEFSEEEEERCLIGFKSRLKSPSTVCPKLS